jgi:hypothetical protein
MEIAKPVRNTTAKTAQEPTVVTHKIAPPRGVDVINATGYGAQ